MSLYNHRAHDVHIAQFSGTYSTSVPETMAPLHVATLTVKREIPKYEIIFSI